MLRTPAESGVNGTEGPTADEIAEICGMNDCPWNELEGTEAEEIPDSTVSRSTIPDITVSRSRIPYRTIKVHPQSRTGQFLNNVYAIQGYFLSHQVWTLVGIYISIALCAILLSIFGVDHLPRHLVKVSGLTIRQELTTLLSSTLRHTIKTKQLLLIPLTVYMGLEESYYSAEYNRVSLMCLNYGT